MFGNKGIIITVMKMKTSALKLNARIINSDYGIKTYFFTYSVILLKLFFLASAVFCTFTLYAFADTDIKSNDIFLNVIYYALFSLGIIFSVCFYILTSYAFKCGFFKTSVTKSNLEFFNFVNFSVQLKIIYLHLLRFFINIFKFLIYLSPSVAVAVTTIYFLKDGIDYSIFFACVVLFTALFITGLFFAFSSIQRLAFLDEVIYLNPTLSPVETVRIAKQCVNGKCFSAAYFKLSFFIWFSLCIFIIPAFFVIPYYNRCISLYAKQTLKVKSPRSVKEKPVIVLKLIGNEA